jgi:hypothetical protein
MKALFNAIAILAIVHLLAVIGLVGFLVGTGRVDDRRIDELTTMLTETTAARDAREAAEVEEAEAEARAAAEDLSQVPLTAEQQIDRKLTLSEADRQVVQRMRREVEDLRRSLRAERELLDETTRAFVAERDAFEAERERVMRTEGDEQFQQVLATLKTMKADLAHELLATTIEQQADGATARRSWTSSTRRIRHWQPVCLSVCGSGALSSRPTDSSKCPQHPFLRHSSRLASPNRADAAVNRTPAGSAMRCTSSRSIGWPRS